MNKQARRLSEDLICRRLLQARESYPLTQAQVAKWMGRPQTYISKLETGERRIPALVLARLSILYEVDLYWLLGIADAEE